MQYDLDAPTAKEGPSFQHRRDVAALTPPGENGVRPVPVVHQANGRQINIVTTQHPEELRVTHGPALCQQGCTKSPQNFQGLHHHQQSKTSIASTEFQHPKPGDHACTSQSSHHQIRRKANAAPSAQMFPSRDQKSNPLLYALLKGNPPNFKYFTSTSSVSAKSGPNAEFKTSTNFSNKRHDRNWQVKSSPASLNCGATRTLNSDHSAGAYLAPHQPKVSPSFLSRQPNKCLVVGEYRSPPALQVPHTDEEILKVISEMVAKLKAGNRQSDSNLPKSNSVACRPTTSAPDKDVTKQSLSCAVTEQSTNAAGQALEEDSSKGSKANAHLSPKSKEKDDTSASEKHSTGTLTSAVEHSKYAPKNESVDKCTSVDVDFPVQTPCRVNDNGKLVCSDLCEDKIFVNGERFHSKRCDRYLMNGITTLHYSLTALKELTASLENVETIAEMDNITEVILQQYWNGDRGNIDLFTSTEYPQIMLEVAATCTKKEEDPVVLTTVSPVLTLSCSSSREDYKSSGVNAEKTLNGRDQASGVCWPFRHITEKEKGDTVLKPMEVDSVRGMTDISDDSWTSGFNASRVANTNKQKNIVCQQYVTSKEAAAHSKLKSSTDKILIQKWGSVTTSQSQQAIRNQTSCESMRKDARENIKELTAVFGGVGERTHSVHVLKNPHYEDISDVEDMPQLNTKLPNTEHEELSCSACLEDTGENEDPQIKTTSVEMSRLMPEVSDPNIKQYGHVQGQAQMKTISDEETIPKTETRDAAQHCSCQYLVEADAGFDCVFCPKCDRERHLGGQTSRSYSPSSVLKDEDEPDDQMDDDWLVIPLIVSDAKFEPVDEDLADPEDVLPDDGEQGGRERHRGTVPALCELHQPASNPGPPSAFPKLEVFDTPESYIQAQGIEIGTGLEISPGRSILEIKAHDPQNRTQSYTESDDSCETDDSCDYTPSLERNYLTVSTQLLTNLSAPTSLETKDCGSEKGNEDQRTNVQKSQPGGRQKPSKNEDIIILDSNTEDESDETWAKTKRRKRSFSSCRRKPSKNEDIIILDSPTDESNNWAKTKRRKRSFSSCSESSGAASSSQQKRQSQSVDSQCGTVQENSPQHLSKCPQKISRQKISNDTETDDDSNRNYKKAKTKSKMSSESVDGGILHGPKPQHRSKRHDTQSKEEMQPSYSELPHSRRSGSEDVQRKIKRRMISKRDHESDRVLRKKAKTARRILSSDSSETEDSNDDAPDNVCATRKPQKNCMSSEDSPQRQSQSVDSGAHTTLNGSPVIPRFIVEQPSQFSERLKLSEQSRIHRQGKDETGATPKTPTATSKNTPQMLHHFAGVRDKQGRFMSKPKPANDAHHAVSKCKPTSSCPRQHSSSIRLQRSHSYSHPSTSDLPSTPPKDPSSSTITHSSAFNKVSNQWENCYIPIRKDRRASLGIEEDSRTKNNLNLIKETNPGPRHPVRASRRRHNSLKSETPLMKRTKSEAKERTKDIKWVPPRQPRCPVSGNYKWKNRSEGCPTKGFRRRVTQYTSPPRLDEWD